MERIYFLFDFPKPKSLLSKEALVGVDGFEPPTLPTREPGCSEMSRAKLSKNEKTFSRRRLSWELTGSNRRPSACKADALNQLS